MASIDYKVSTDGADFKWNIENADVKAIKKSLEISLIGTFLMSKYFCKQSLKNEHHSSILNFASDLSILISNDTVYGDSNNHKPIDYAISKEIGLLEEAWKRISTNGAIAYGKDELNRALNEGAIEKLLISADLLRADGEQIDGQSWQEWSLKLAKYGGAIVQCSTDHDSGQQLLGMGGAIALLRFKI